MILLGGGIWAMVDRSGFKEIVAAHDLLHTAAYIIITVGSVLFIVGFMGCFGAIRENRPILMIFFVLILMIFLMEFICGILAFIFRKHLNEKYFLDELKDLYQGDNHTEVFTTTWNSIMITFSCCGVTGMDDFKEAVKFNALFPGFVVPEVQISDCPMPWDILPGCYNKIVDYMKEYMYLTLSLVVVVMLIEVMTREHLSNLVVGLTISSPYHSMSLTKWP
uniref:Tetraspanin n=1 Tax=Callorhinchus milii TaxID=7868 RepID=A0A4W3GZZ4_CALMI